jgi:hypothetical protein
MCTAVTKIPRKPHGNVTLGFFQSRTLMLVQRAQRARTTQLEEARNGKESSLSSTRWTGGIEDRRSPCARAQKGRSQAEGSGDGTEPCAADARRCGERVSGGASAVRSGSSKEQERGSWQHGGLTSFGPGKVCWIPINAQREGRIFFAGEHTSRWNRWMQGAIESAHGVVREISA